MLITAGGIRQGILLSLGTATGPPTISDLRAGDGVADVLYLFNRSFYNIDSAGRVLVGHTSPQTDDRLQVNGSVRVPTGRGFRVGDNQVLGERSPAVADATDGASAAVQLNALLAHLRAHGLIAT